MISDKFISNIPKDFVEGVKYITESFSAFHQQLPEDDEVSYYLSYIEYWSLLSSYLTSNGYTFESIELAQSKKSDIKNIAGFFNTISSEFEQKYTNQLITTSKEKYDLLFGNVFLYEFSDGDIKIIQNLINELRDIVTSSELFSAEHKERILRKLEKMQSELHKKVSNLDRFWGLIGDAGVVIGKFGNDAKPIVDRIKEIADIVWRTQARSEELPSGTKIPFLTTKTVSDPKE